MRYCSICARGGSKGVPNKNIRKVGGIPLIHFTIIQAMKSGLFTDIAVSSDSEEILECVSVFKELVLIKRPDSLATDAAPKLPVIKHCLEETEKIKGRVYDTVVDLDATSPLRNIEDISGAIRLMESFEATNVITGAPARRSPYFNLVEEKSDGFVQLSKESNPPIVRRQDAPSCFDMNASIYVWKRESLLSSTKVITPKTLLFEMPEERSIDIDSELDFKIVSMLLKERMHEFT